MEPLHIDEVMALQMLGWPTSKIRRTDLAQFERTLATEPELTDLLDRANDLLDRQEARGIVSISCQDADFPKRLLEIGDDCPAAIHCKGRLDLLKAAKAVAIIGARAADREGNDMAYDLGRKHAEAGYVVVSGLALGCDAAAHNGCLDAGGDTIAIVASGLDICHPKENKPLETRILEHGGLLITEQTIGVKANPTRLVARNRLQAAISDKVILAQCPAKSGSLHTMRFARQYHKQCLAASFPLRTEANAGNFALIDQKLATPLQQH